HRAHATPLRSKHQLSTNPGPRTLARLSWCELHSLLVTPANAGVTEERSPPTRSRELVVDARVFRIRAPAGRRASLRGVVHLGGVLQADGEGKAADRGVGAHRAQAVDGVGRNLHQVALADLGRLALDGHDAAAADDIVELEGVMLVGVDLAAAHHLEL